MEDLEERLVRERWINPNQLIKAKEDSRNKKKSLFSSLIKLGYLDQESIFIFFALNSNIPWVRLSDYEIREDVLALFSEDFYRSNIFIPLCRVDNNLYLAMANPFDVELLTTISNRTGLNIQPLFSSPYSIQKALDKYFGFPDSFFKMEDLIFKSEGLYRYPFYRDSKRVTLNIPLEFKIADGGVSLAFSSYIVANTANISPNGKGVGIKTFLFIPPGTKLLIKFISSQAPSLQIKAEVTHCKMRRKGEFVMGVKFEEVSAEVMSYLSRLVELAEENK